jgi:hypothetical protein
VAGALQKIELDVVLTVSVMSIRRELDYLDLSQNKLASVEGLDSLENVAFVSLGEWLGSVCIMEGQERD